MPAIKSSCPVTSLIQSVGSGRQRRKAARPQELLEAALTLFVEKGFAATRTEEVARMAGVSKGTLYLYYPSKDELFKAVVRTHLSEVIAEGSGIVEQFEGPTSELLHLLAHTWWSRVGASKASGIMLVIITEANNFPDLIQFYMDEVVAPAHAMLTKAVQRGMDRGEFRDMDVSAVVHALIAPVHFLVLYQHCSAACSVNPVPLDPPQFMATQIELLLRGLVK
ncbi:TetR/AcrR family transcriptional regulator [Aquabacterium sp.]|uniref:TetR/AcrR family transcriptional regulator n=1 Tax=Aquabacterium sp. TaxID=1872578 RepID=UPI0025BD8EEE|nr:TetR/AcrR family transcriptional regulator [Aquabacterium sp.]